MSTYTVVLRRANGRVVKQAERSSKYSAKRLKQEWEEKYEETYQITVERKNG